MNCSGLAFLFQYIHGFLIFGLWTYHFGCLARTSPLPCYGICFPGNILFSSQISTFTGLKALFSYRTNLLREEVRKCSFKFGATSEADLCFMGLMNLIHMIHTQLHLFYGTDPCITSLEIGLEKKKWGRVHERHPWLTICGVGSTSGRHQQRKLALCKQPEGVLKD